MHVRSVSRSFCMFALAGATLVTAISCGGSGSDTGGRDASLDGTGPALNLEAGGAMGTKCVPKSCAQQGYTCGYNSDGCGNVVMCGGCTGSGEFCGGGGYSKCGTGLDGGADGSAAATCKAKTCADLPAGTCGQQSDGCGGLTPDCTPCTAPQFCGGGGPSLCGGGGSGGDGGGDGGPCIPKTCLDFPTGTCGAQSDGCGSLTANCSTCPGNEFCGGGGPALCGGFVGSDGGGLVLTCAPMTCAALGNPCGLQGDGCGGLLTCTTCTAPATCGGGGPNTCGGTGGSTGDGGTGSGADGGGGTCNPKTCASYPAGTCGPQSDGCGGLTANCGTCTDPTFCGGGGVPGQCGGNNHMSADGGVVSSCVPATCQSLGYNCGFAGDGCGGTIGPCGPSCIAPQICGGSGHPNVCGSNVPCTGLCTQQVACDGGATTTIVGTVVAATPTTYLPAGVTLGDPVPNVLVYVPNGTVQPFIPRAMETAAQQCTTCGADVSGDPLVLTYTSYMGTFTLSNVPVGNNIPIVIQLGRWRRQFTVNVTNPCGTNTVNDPTMPAGILKMPNNHTVGDIPLTALSTGQVDALECVLLKMGIDTAEFTTNTATPQGRVNLYVGNGANISGGGAPNEATLMGNGGTFNDYDQILFPCWGNPFTKTAAELANLISYADSGGHFFATHYSYTWLNTNGEFQGTAQWDVNANNNINSTTGIVSQTVPPANPGTFVEWLNFVGALSNATTPPAAPPNPANVLIDEARHNVDTVLGNSVSWITGTDPAPARHDPAEMLLHYTFDTPVMPAAGASQCGHAIYSDFHVTNQNNTSGFQFPNDAATECGNTPMTAQQKILEFMIWDLGSCVPGAPTATCTPMTCADYPAGTCGQQTDGCGNLTANCGSCTAPQTCGGCGVAGQCCAPSEDSGACIPLTCANYPTGTCGQQSDGCGALTVDCPCTAPQTCGGGGIAGMCGSPPSEDAGSGSSCVPFTCASYPAGTCGQQSDGCGGLTPDCSPCPAGQTCGGCGVVSQCCAPPPSTCTPQTCGDQGIACGPAGDGCGNVIASCGSCTAPQTCGGCGMPGQCCGSSMCVPETCGQQSIACGPAGDGCGNLIPNGCGTCPAGQTCGGCGVPGQCCATGGTCTPKTCAQLNINCGPAGDGCGNLIPSCGTCKPPDTCGGAGTSGQCGSPVAQ